MDEEGRKGGKISASDFDIVHTAYRALVGDAKIDEAVARRHATNLLIELTNEVEIDDELIARIIRP
jgi:Arc/MetJ family transcription regulator